MDVQKETSEIRELKANELDDVSGGFVQPSRPPVGPAVQPVQPDTSGPGVNSGFSDGTSGAGGTYVPDPYGDVYRKEN
jgi:hypothetical protein